MPEGKTTSGLYMSDDLRSGLRQLANLEKRSFNSYVNIILKAHYEKEKKQLKKTLVKRRAA